MTGNTLEQRARELLAEAHEHYYGKQTDYRVFANAVRRGEYDSTPEMHAVKAALRLSAGEGWVMVPMEPTEAMLDAGWAEGAKLCESGAPDFAAAWEAMLSAAPRHETGEG